MPRARRHHDAVEPLPLATDQELDLALEHLEALLERRVQVRRDASAWIDPHPERQHVAVALDAIALLEDRVFD